MNILSVIPITKGLPQETLTYFSAKDVEIGNMVMVPLRKKSIPAIVIEINTAENQKGSLKSAHFNIRKVDKIIGPSPFPNGLINGAIDLAPYYASSAGAILDIIIPQKLFDNIGKLKQNISNEKENNNEKIKSEVLIFQAPYEERLSHYKTLIRQSFARRQSIYFIVPTKADVHFYKKEFSRGIEDFVHTYTSDTSIKDTLNLWKIANEEEHPILVIGTVAILSFPRSDLSLIILEHEQSVAYRTFERPHLDQRIVAEICAQKMSIPIIIGDTLLRIETLYKYDNGIYGAVRPPSYRAPYLSDTKIFPLRNENDKFTLFSKPLKKTLENLKEKNEHIMLFVPRKGLAPITICNNCAHIVGCKECNAPLILYNKKNERIYSCNRCGYNESSKILCQKCGGWDLVPLGIGTETVEYACRDICTAPIFIIDREHIKNPIEGEKLINNFLKQPSGVLIGTEYALSFLREQIDKIAIITLDSLFALPHFRVEEKLISLVFALKERSLAPLLIQTSHTDDEIINHIKSGNLLAWYKQSLSDRQTLHYPPFVHFISIKAIGNKIQTKNIRDELKNKFANYDPYIETILKNKTKEIYQTTLVIKVDIDNWPSIGTKNEALMDFHLYLSIITLPPIYSIEINGEQAG